MFSYNFAYTKGGGGGGGMKRLSTSAMDCIRTEAVHCQFAFTSTASGPRGHETSWNQVEDSRNRLESQGRVRYLASWIF